MISYTLDHTLVWLYIAIAAASLFAALNLAIYTFQLRDKYRAMRRELRRYQREEERRAREGWEPWSYK